MKRSVIRVHQHQLRRNHHETVMRVDFMCGDSRARGGLRLFLIAASASF